MKQQFTQLLYCFRYCPILWVVMAFFVSPMTPLKAQSIGLHGDIYVASDAALAFHSPTIHFYQGIISSSETNPGQVIFMDNSYGDQPDDNAHISADVVSKGHVDFVFPVGDSGVYQPLRIQEGSTADLSVRLKRDSPPTQSLTAPLERLSNHFYWTVEGTKSARLSLSWNNSANMGQLTDDPNALLMAGYNGTVWEVIPAQLEPFTFDGNEVPTSLNEGAITSTARVDFSNYSAFSIGAMTLHTALQIAEAITPNGDGMNDTWFIENIERYPEGKIWVYNRWGSEVFHSAGNYRNNWDGTYKDNTKKLPTGPYYYRIDQDNNGTIDLDGWIYITY